MTRPVIELKLKTEFARLQNEGKDFCPADIASRLGINVKEVTGFLRYQDRVQLKQKCTVYRCSVWGFMQEKKMEVQQ
jgi:hypothetical protein